MAALARSGIAGKAGNTGRGTRSSAAFAAAASAQAGLHAEGIGTEDLEVVVVINLAVRRDRRSAFEERFRKMKRMKRCQVVMVAATTPEDVLNEGLPLVSAQRYGGPLTKRAAITATVLSHARALRELARIDRFPALVAEDDLVLTPSWPKRLPIPAGTIVSIAHHPEVSTADP